MTAGGNICLQEARSGATSQQIWPLRQSDLELVEKYKNGLVYIVVTRDYIFHFWLLLALNDFHVHFMFHD